MQWLLGFSWDQKTCQKVCLFFVLATSPFIFNHSAETIHWMLQSYLGCRYLEHYLDNFIHVLAADLATLQ